MAYYKVRIEVWCDWDPKESDLEEIAESINAGEAICTKREVARTAIIVRRVLLWVEAIHGAGIDAGGVSFTPMQGSAMT